MNTIQTSSANIERPKWGTLEKEQWLSKQKIKRSYRQEVVTKIQQLTDRFDVNQYSVLSYDPDKYPLFLVKSKVWNDELPVILVTGGVHGYETSGVQGAICFLETQAEGYSNQFNFVVAPCISPWGYETINRWNPYCVDPNRSFYADNLSNETAHQQVSEEANSLMKALASMEHNYLAHIDLHETTDSDNNEFIPALNARDGKVASNRETPDGFYLVDDSENSQPGCVKHIIKAVGNITHIAPADEQGYIIGSPIVQQGVINYALESLGLCAGVTNAKYRITTEVYPDSPKANDEICIQAQVTSVTSLLEYLSKNS
jgi:hypothetical protein